MTIGNESLPTCFTNSIPNGWLFGVKKSFTPFFAVAGTGTIQNPSFANGNIYSDTITANLRY